MKRAGWRFIGIISKLEVDKMLRKAKKKRALAAKKTGRKINEIQKEAGSD